MTIKINELKMAKDSLGHNYSVYFKSESCDDYHYHVTIEDGDKLTESELDNVILQWLFEEEEVDGGCDEWGETWDEIPYNTLSVHKLP